MLSPSAKCCQIWMDIGLSQRNAKAAPIRKRISAATQKGIRPRFSRSVSAGPTKRAVS